MKKNSKVTAEETAAFEAELDREFGLSDDEDDAAETASTQPKAETTEEKMARLEAELEQGRAKLKKKVSAKALSELNAKSAELEDLRKRNQREKAVKERYRKQYANTFATDADFDRLWETKLREQAMMEEADSQTKEGQSRLPSIYRDF